MTLPYWSMMRGDSTPFEFTVTDDGEPIDLTGLELTWTAKRYWDQTGTGVITKTLGDGIEVVSAADGTIIVQMDPDDTNGIESYWSHWPNGHSYVWDLETLDEYEQIRTRGRGVLNVYKDVTVPAT